MLLLAGASLLAGCGGSGSGAGRAPASSATVVTKHIAGYGTVLATSSGQALYVLTSDPPGGTRCTGACTVRWHPLLEQGRPTAGPGVNPSMLSTFKRSDGRVQVLYDDRALYTYTGSGQAGGAGIPDGDGIWFLISPAGKPVEQTTGGGY